MLAKKNTRRAREEYQRRRYEEKKIHRRKKKEAWKGLMMEMEEAGRQKETRKFYRTVNIPYPTAFPYGNATFLTTAKHRLRCGHLNFLRPFKYSQNLTRRDLES